MNEPDVYPLDGTPFDGLDRPEPVAVIAPSKHAVKLAVIVRQNSKSERYVVECVCGWSLSLHFHQQPARDEYFTDAWAVPLCTLRCMRESALTVDGEPYCIECADLLIEREIAVSQNPELVALLPPLTYGKEAYETFKLSRGVREVSRTDEPEAWAKLDAARAQWLADHSPAPASRAGRRLPDTSRRAVTRDEPHEPKPEPAGQLSLLADTE